VNYAFSLPLPTSFQADWGLKVVDAGRHKAVCVRVCVCGWVSEATLEFV